MLFIATYQKKPNVQEDIQQKATDWWNGGGCPPGLKLLSCYRPVSTDEASIMVFEADSGEDLEKLVSYWRNWSFDIRPARDEMAAWRAQGMHI